MDDKYAAIRRLHTLEPYRSMRLFFLRMHPLCRPCSANGFTVAAAEIDHIVSVKHAPDRFLDLLELAAYLPPMPRTEDGHGDPPPLHDAGAGRVAGASDGDRQPGNCTMGVSLRRWLAGRTRPRGARALPPALLGQGLSGRPQDGERLEAIARSWGSPWRGATSKRQSASMDPEAIGPLLLDIRAAGPTEEEGPDMSDKESVLEGIQKAIDMVSALCAGKQKWILSIPPQPERDPDLVILRALTAARRIGGPRAWFPVGIQSRRPPHRPDRPRPPVGPPLETPDPRNQRPYRPQGHPAHFRRSDRGRDHGRAGPGLVRVDGREAGHRQPRHAGAVHDDAHGRALGLPRPQLQPVQEHPALPDEAD